MVKLNTANLGEYCQIDSGYAFKSAQFTNNEDDICLVKGSNLAHRKINWEDAPRWSLNEFNQLARYQLIVDDVVVAMDRPIVGGNLKFAWIQRSDPKALLVQRVARLRGKNGLDQKYLKSVIADPAFKAYIDTITTGVNVPHISGPVPLPPLPTQQKIAQILSAYDDLIENNLKRIKRLEEMAQITYEQWFVRMKFPNHKNTAIDNKTGLPEGWKKRDILELCQKITDGTHDSPKQVEQGIPLITGKHISNGFINFDSAYLISKDDHNKIKKRSGLEKGDILFSNIGTLGNIGVVIQDFEYSCKNVIIFKKKQGFDNFLYTYLSSKYTKEKLDFQSSGVAQKFYSLKFIRGLNEILPDNKLIKAFDDIVSPLYKLKYQLDKQNQRLKEARDILLPRLMTGIIDVDKITLPKQSSHKEAKLNDL